MKKLIYLKLAHLKNAAAAFFIFQNAKINFLRSTARFIFIQIKRIENFQIDNSSEIEIEKKIIEPKLKFDIIIEDAGHYLKDQIITLFMLFECLNPMEYL